MKKFAFAAALLLFLVGCGSAETEIPAPTPEATPAATAAPAPTAAPEVKEEIIELFGEKINADVESLDMSAMTAEDTDELVSVLQKLENIREINFVREDGTCVYTLDDLNALGRVREAVPGAKLRVSFELFGQTVTSEDERIEYFRVPIGNEGAETVRAVLPYLTSCTYFLMDGCGIDYEILAQLRDDFPDTKIVWRVWLTSEVYNSERQMRLCSFLTDTHRIRTIVVTDDNCQLLKYCTETKYVDFGHNFAISDFSFLGCMPKLEAAIIAITKANDISFLENCPELEYLEVYGTDITDISPIANCTKLKHLNISRMDISDITSIYDLNLDRLRCVATKVPKEQLEKYAELHPDCEMLLAGYAPHQNGWRFDENDHMVPRYALLREQMEYDIDFSYGIP